MSRDVFSEEDLHENLFRSVGSSNAGIPLGDNFNEGDAKRVLKRD